MSIESEEREKKIRQQQNWKQWEEDLQSKNLDEEEQIKMALELSKQDAQEQEKKKEQRFKKMVTNVENSTSNLNSTAEGSNNNEISSTKNNNNYNPQKKPTLVRPTTKKQLFHLHSIVRHIGLSAHSGHYVSDIFNVFENEWRLYNDATVTQQSEQTVLSNEFESYLLFYIHENCWFKKEKM